MGGPQPPNYGLQLVELTQDREGDCPDEGTRARLRKRVVNRVLAEYSPHPGEKQQRPLTFKTLDEYAALDPKERRYEVDDTLDSA